MRMIKLLVGNPPQSISELMETLAVTRTAVTEQLHELVRAGFVERQTQHLYNRGRPQFVYQATTTAALILNAQNQCTVVPTIWRVLEELGGAELMRKVLKKTAKKLAENYTQQITARNPEERLRQLAKLMNAEGCLTDATVSGGRVVLRKRSCEFQRMVDDKHSICCLDQEMMTIIVGNPLKRTACRHDGSPCCTFEIASKKK
jgi:predicted ArsR family transcriptional regulator